MKYSSRFWLYAPTGLFLLLAVAVMVHWWMAAGAFEKKLAALKGREAVPGIILTWATAEVGGFPFRLDANFQNLSVAGAGAHGPFSWRSEKFAMHGLTYGRSQDVYEATGRQQVSWTDATSGHHTASFLSGSMRGSSIQNAQGLRRFDLDIVDLEASDFAAGRFQFHLRRTGGGLDMMVKIDTLQPRDAKPGNLQFYATLNPAGPLHALLDGTTSWPTAAGGWRAQGGTAKLSQAVTTGEITPQMVLSALY
ncbi:MAG: DUF2125 domain-containing protein [Rhizomicrobium sp.]